MREKILFDENWLFHQGDIHRAVPQVKGPVYTAAKTERMKWGPASIAYNDHPDDYRAGVEFSSEKWEPVSLPHDYVIAQKPRRENNPALGFFDYPNAWYRKHFTVPASDENRRLTLLFEGVATRATVYLNGCELLHHFCGYSSFEVDITDYIIPDADNVLAVYVKADDVESWWYQGAGIYRHVWLIKTDLVAVDLWGVYAAPQKISDTRWQLDVQTTVRNDRLEDVTASIINVVKDAAGQTVATMQTEVFAAAREKTDGTAGVVIDSPQLWDVKRPYLYHIETSVVVNGETVDRYDVRFGFRHCVFDPQKGFFLNGKPVKIKGVCAHQDFGLTGKAVPDNIHRYKVQLIKEMGANGYRTSHYPHPQAVMDALDDMGILVMAETRWFDSTEDGKRDLEMLIKRDRNHPSVIMWSLGNEEPFHITQQGRKINRSLIAHLKKFDHTRPVTTAVSVSPDQATVFDDLDLIGVNYNHWLLDQIHEKYPDKPIFWSECCATSTTRGWCASSNPARGYLPAQDQDTNSWFTGREFAWKFVMQRPWMFGAFQWIAIEHRGEAGWPRVCSQSGAIDLFLQKKEAFYQNQSHWLAEPMVYILPHWNWAGRENEEIEVVVYTNCDEIELMLNDQSICRMAVPPFTAVHQKVCYKPGVLKCIGYRKGELAAQHERQTTGKPERLLLHLDNDPPKANGQDIAMITCCCVDENGLEVPDAMPFVRFDTNALGKVVGTGSDVSDHVPVNCPDRRMRAGRIGIAVKAGKTAGKLQVFAQAENLIGAVLEIPLSE